MDKLGHKTLETMAFAKWYNEWLYSLMKRYLGKDILEVGVGIGNFTKLLSKSDKVTAVDIDRGYIDKLKEEEIENALFGYGDIEKGRYFFEGKKFDSIVCLNVLEHIKNDNKALKNMNSLLKKEGKLILLVPAFTFLYSDFDKLLGHYRRYRLKDILKKVESSGFEVVSKRFLNWWAAIGWFLFIKMPKRKEMPKSPVKIFDAMGKIFLFPEKFIKPPFGLSVFVIAERK